MWTQTAAGTDEVTFSLYRCLNTIHWNIERVNRCKRLGDSFYLFVAESLETRNELTAIAAYRLVSLCYVDE